MPVPSSQVIPPLLINRFRHRIYPYRIRLKKLFEASRKRNFVFITGSGRSGSQLLLTYLNNLPGFSLCRDEPLHPRQLDSYGLKFRSGRQALAWLDCLMHDLPHAMTGAKLLNWHFELHGLDLAMIQKAFPGAKFINIYRRNVFEQFVSFKTAKASNVWHRTKGQAPLSPPMIYFDRSEFRNYEGAVRYFHELLHTQLKEGETLLSAAYEDLNEDPERLFSQKIGPFLGLAPVPELKTHLVKSIESSYADFIVNYDEVSDLHCESL